MRVVKAVVFDVGETLVDESREYGAWADWLGVPRHTFSSVFGAVIALEWFAGRRSPSTSIPDSAWIQSGGELRAEAGQPETFGEGNLSPTLDRPCRRSVTSKSGSASQATRRPTQGTSFVRWICRPIGRDLG